jgi:sigma-E factor negative regulatory protein RseC
MAESAMLCKDGKVVGVEGGHFKVKITTPSACATCHAKSLCSSLSPQDQKEREILVTSRQPLEIGDTVSIEMEERLGWIALFYSFILPFLVMILVLFGLFAFGLSQTTSALIAIVSLAPYYLVLYKFRSKLEKDFVFLAVKKD